MRLNLDSDPADVHAAIALSDALEAKLMAIASEIEANEQAAVDSDVQPSLCRSLSETPTKPDRKQAEPASWC